MYRGRLMQHLYEMLLLPHMRLANTDKLPLNRMQAADCSQRWYTCEPR